MVVRPNTAAVEATVRMQVQRCPNCGLKNDVSVYVNGQLTRCTRCGIRFPVDRPASISTPNDLHPVPTPPGEHPVDQRTDVSVLRATPVERGAEPDSRLSPPPAPRAPTPPTLLSVGNAALRADITPAVVIAPDIAHATPDGPAPLTSGQLFPTPADRPTAQRAAPANANTEVGATSDGRPIIPGYECVQLLGRGGMGEVWRANQLSLGRTVAVKILSPTLAVEPDFVRRFERESSALATLANPNIVSVFDRGSANGHWYFVMEFVEGRSLRERFTDARPSRMELLRLVAQVARAVDYAHQKGVIHRDLKPENVLIDHTGAAKVADFGLAGMSEVGRSSLTMTAVAMGTAHYMAPEQRRDAKNVDGRADLYSLGVMLYELLCGEVPAGRFASPREKLPELDPRLDSLVMRLLEQDPTRRPARASEVAEVLERVSQGPKADRQLAAPLPRTQVLSSVVRDVRQSPQKMAMLVAAAIVLILVLGIAIAKGSGAPLVRLAAKVERAQPGRAQITLGTGAPDAIYAVGVGWSIQKNELVREAMRGTEKRAPRAYVMPVRMDFDNAAEEADVTLDDKGVAELVLYRDVDRHVGLRLTAGEDVSYTLFSSSQVKGKAAAHTEDGPHEKLQAGRKYHVELYVLNGRATAVVDKRQVASAQVPGLSGVRAKAGVGCKGTRCRFSNLRLAGAISDQVSALGGASSER